MERFPEPDARTKQVIDRLLQQYTFASFPPHCPKGIYEGDIFRLDLDHVNLPLWFVDVSFDTTYPDMAMEPTIDASVVCHWRQDGHEQILPNGQLAGRFLVSVAKYIGTVLPARWCIGRYERQGLDHRMFWPPSTLFPNPPVRHAMTFVGMAMVRALAPELPLMGKTCPR